MESKRFLDSDCWCGSMDSTPCQYNPRDYIRMGGWDDWEGVSRLFSPLTSEGQGQVFSKPLYAASHRPTAPTLRSGATRVMNVVANEETMMIDGIKLSRRQAMYASWILGTWYTEAPPAKLDGDVLVFLGDDGESDFIEALRDEIAYDRGCGRGGRVGPALLRKVQAI